MAQGFYPDATSQSLRAISPVGFVDYNPSLIATAGRKGTLLVQAGTSILWQKQDNGRTTNWTIFSGGSVPAYYPVYPNGPYPTIQSAIDQAVLDGYGGLNTAVVDVFPGVYVGNVDLAVGINLTSNVPGAAVIEGRVRALVPPGGMIPGESFVIINVLIRQQAGLQAILIQAAPGDFGVIAVIDCSVTSFLPLETIAAIESIGNTAIMQIFNLKGFALSSDPSYYMIQSAGLATTIRDTAINVNSNFLHVVAGAVQMSNVNLSQDSNSRILITQDTGSTCSIHDSSLSNFQVGPQIGVQLATACDYFSVGTGYVINSDPGSRCVAGVAGSNYYTAYDTYLFSDQISAAMNLIPIVTVPVPV